MRKNLFFSTLISASIFILGTMQSAQAAIVQGTINNSEYAGSIDFNNDGTAEFFINSSTAYPDLDCISCVIRYNYDDVTSIWTVGNLDQGGWDNVRGLTAGTSIGANGNWASEGDAYLVDMGYSTPNINLNADVYVGFRFKINGNTHYGWAKVRLTGDDNNGYSAQWIQCAYESTPNTAIAAGALSTVAIAENQSNILRVYPNPTTDFVVVEMSQTDDNVSVFDMNGRQINAAVRFENNSAIIDMTAQPVGTYYVRTKQMTSKFIKK